MVRNPTAREAKAFTYGREHTEHHSGRSGGLVEWAADWIHRSGRRLAAHHKLLLAELDAVSRGDFDRLMVLMPPGAAKSTYTAVLFPAWWFLQHPRSSIITASHTASLAVHFAKQAKSLIEDNSTWLGYEIDTRARAAGQWRTSNGGEYFAAGIRGPITGRRADLAIIDDPVKNQAEADSLKQRNHLWDWYRYDLTTRLKPNARVVLVMTRWHDDDLAGRLLAQSMLDWRCVKLPAMAREADPLGRPPGSPLWPEWESAKALERKRASVGERVWSAMFQQEPAGIEGSLFAVSRLELVDTMPTGKLRSVRAWDLAASADIAAGDPDWTVGVKLATDESGRFIVLDVIRLRGSVRTVEEALAQTAKLDGPEVIIGLPEDPGQAGKSQTSYLKRLLAGYSVVSSKETGSKETRARPIASQVEGGNVSILRAPWNYAFVEELRDFPYGRKDDQVDALSRAFATLTGVQPGSRRLNVSLFSR